MMSSLDVVAGGRGRDEADVSDANTHVEKVAGLVACGSSIVTSTGDMWQLKGLVGYLLVVMVGFHMEV